MISSSVVDPSSVRRVRRFHSNRNLEAIGIRTHAAGNISFMNLSLVTRNFALINLTWNWFIRDIYINGSVNILYQIINNSSIGTVNTGFVNNMTLDLPCEKSLIGDNSSLQGLDGPNNRTGTDSAPGIDYSSVNFLISIVLMVFDGVLITRFISPRFDEIRDYITNCYKYHPDDGTFNHGLQSRGRLYIV